MQHDAILARILRAVDDRAYRTPSAAADPEQKSALEEISTRLADGSVDIADVKAFVRRLHEASLIDEVHMLSAMGVIAASPRVADYAEALRLANVQEQAARRQGGPRLEMNLASVDRHRGVALFLAGRFDAALEYFTAALERQRTPENLGNVLATLLRVGDIEQAEAILAQARESLPQSFRLSLAEAIETDPDLAALRSPETS